MFGPVSSGSHDDDDDPKEPDRWKHTLKVAVLTAAFTALATGLAEWAVDELREFFGRPEKPVKPEKPAVKPPEKVP